MTFDFTRLPFAARALIALIRFHLVLQLAGWIQMVVIRKYFIFGRIRRLPTCQRLPMT